MLLLFFLEFFGIKFVCFAMDGWYIRYLYGCIAYWLGFTGRRQWRLEGNIYRPNLNIMLMIFSK